MKIPEKKNFLKQIFEKKKINFFVNPKKTFQISVFYYYFSKKNFRKKRFGKKNFLEKRKNFLFLSPQKTFREFFFAALYKNKKTTASIEWRMKIKKTASGT